MKTHFDSMKPDEFHQLVDDWLERVPPREKIPSMYRGFTEYQKVGQLLVPSMMANVVINRFSFVGQSRWGRSFWRNSIFARMVVGPVPPQVDSVGIVDLENPDRSLVIHAYPENHSGGVRVLEGDIADEVITMDRSVAIRMPTEADRDLLNRVLEAAITNPD